MKRIIPIIPLYIIILAEETEIRENLILNNLVIVIYDYNNSETNITEDNN